MRKLAFLLLFSAGCSGAFPCRDAVRAGVSMLEREDQAFAVARMTLPGEMAGPAPEALLAAVQAAKASRSRFEAAAMECLDAGPALR
jgi:hypothetical protein